MTCGVWKRNSPSPRSLFPSFPVSFSLLSLLPSSHPHGEATPSPPPPTPSARPVRPSSALPFARPFPSPRLFLAHRGPGEPGKAPSMLIVTALACRPWRSSGGASPWSKRRGQSSPWSKLGRCFAVVKTLHDAISLSLSTYCSPLLLSYIVHCGPGLCP